MNDIRSYRLQLVTDPTNFILDAFSTRFKSKVKHLLVHMKQSGIKFNTDESISLQSGETINDVIYLIKYHIFPKFFNLKKPKKYNKFISALKQKQCSPSPNGARQWLSYKN